MKLPKRVRIIWAMVALVAAMPASGEVLTEHDGLDAREIVSDQELDGMRGGLVMANGVEFLFNFEWIVNAVDGSRVARTPVFSATGEAISPSSLERFYKILGGEVGTVQPGSTADVYTRPLIQNYSDKITIDAKTVMNVAAFNLPVVRPLNISPILISQIIQSLR